MRFACKVVLGLAMGLALAAGFGGRASAQPDPGYFRGKTVNFVVATEPGGGYDTYGRLVAEFMQKHLPGSTFVVRNMPGAGHMIAANYIYASATDGLTIGTFNTGLIYAQIKGDPAARFDLTRMSWVGKVASDPRVLIISGQSGIESFEQLRGLDKPVRFAAGGVGSASTVESDMLIRVLGLPIQLITGYNGNEGLLAMRRGEVQGQLASRSSVEIFARDGGGRIIAQIGGAGDAVPQLSSFAKDEAAVRAISLVESQVDIVRLVAGPPGIAPDVLETLRQAFEKAVGDEEFLKRAESLRLPVDPLVGDAVAAVIRTALDQPPEMVEFVKEMMAK